MTKEEKSRYSEPEALRDILKRVLSGRKFMLDCGHHVSLCSTTWETTSPSSTAKSRKSSARSAGTKSKEVFDV